MFTAQKKQCRQRKSPMCCRFPPFFVAKRICWLLPEKPAVSLISRRDSFWLRGTCLMLPPRWQRLATHVFFSLNAGPHSAITTSSRIFARYRSWPRLGIRWCTMPRIACSYQEVRGMRPVDNVSLSRHWHGLLLLLGSMGSLWRSTKNRTVHSAIKPLSFLSLSLKGSCVCCKRSTRCSKRSKQRVLRNSSPILCFPFPPFPDSAFLAPVVA